MKLHMSDYKEKGTCGGESIGLNIRLDASNDEVKILRKNSVPMMGLVAETPDGFDNSTTKVHLDWILNKDFKRGVLNVRQLRDIEAQLETNCRKLQKLIDFDKTEEGGLGGQSRTIDL